MTTTKIPHEHRLLHPRIAYWIEEQKLLYLYEYKVRGGQVDFLTICPRSGCISIIEGKMNARPDEVISQVNRYERALGVTDICKIAFSYNPVSEWHWNMFEMAGFELFVTGEDAPAAPIKKRDKTLNDFWSVFEYFYERPLTDIYRWSSSDDPVSIAFTLSELRAFLEDEGDEAMKVSFHDGWGVLDLPIEEEPKARFVRPQ